LFLRFSCPSCQKAYRIPDERLTGGVARLRCPNCKVQVRLRVVHDANGNPELAASLEESGAHAPVDPLKQSQPLQDATDASKVAHPPQPEGGAPRPARITGTDLPHWYVVKGSDRVGPMTLAAVAQLADKGEVAPTTYVWNPSMANWLHASDVPEIARLLRPRPVQPAPPAPPPPPAAGPQPRPMRTTGQQRPIQSTGQHAAQQAPAPAKGPLPAGYSGDEDSATMEMRVIPRAGAEAEGGPTLDMSSPAVAAALHKPENKHDAKPTQKAPQKAAQKPATPGAQAASATPKHATPAPAPKAEAGAFFSTPAAPEQPDASMARKVSASTADNFFSEAQDMGKMVLDLPDPNRHKPTKQEYKNLIQEFSVMFRLDKRSKRQKVMIWVVVSSLLAATAAFGLVLWIQGEQKAKLIENSQKILETFNLQYQQSVTVSTSQKAPSEAGKPAGAEKVKVAEVTGLAEKLAKTAAGGRRKKAAATAQAGGPVTDIGGNGGERPEVKKGPLKEDDSATVLADREAEEKRLAEALKKKKASDDDEKSEKLVGATTNDVTQDKLKAMCREHTPGLRACAQKFVGGGSFTLRGTVTAGGRVANVRATVDGEAHGELAGCAASKLGSVGFGSQSKPTHFSCKVD